MTTPPPPPRNADFTPSQIEARLVRYADMRPCYNAFIDTRTPGSEAKENFTIIGPGVSENPEQHVHITEPHGFNIGGARQPPGCVNSQHSHNTAEVFVVHTGHWRFDLGERGEDASLFMGPGDVISIPTGIFRGFTNVGEEIGYLFAVLGQDDPGKVLWAPDVFEMAREHGLILLETGQLIDTVAGQDIPPGARPMPATTPEQVAALKRVRADEASGFLWRNQDSASTCATAIVGESAPLDWEHGFAVDRLDIEGGDRLELSPAGAAEVVFVHRGSLELCWPGGTVQLGEGDTISVPCGLDRSFLSLGGCVAYVVRR